MSWEGAVSWLREQADQQALVRACFFDDPLIDAAQRYRASTEWQAMRKLLPLLPARVLDLGAGRGIVCYALASDAYDVTALEPDPSHLVGAGAIRSLAADAGLAIKVVEEWGEELPFNGASFDLVICRQVLHHARDLGQLCRQIARVLKPGGRLIATREHVLSRPEDLSIFLARHPLQSRYGGEHAYCLAEYENSIRRAGLCLKQTFNPLESDINMFPSTVSDYRNALARRLHIPKWLVPQRLIRWIGARSDAPGRLYSFVAVKQ
jgi:SAM-dependent methyltransferase